MGNEQASQIVQAPGIETNQGESARHPMVRLGTKTPGTLAKTENMIMPCWMLPRNDPAQRLFKFCHQSRQPP